VGIVFAAFCEQRYERSEGKYYETKDDDYSYAHRSSPVFDFGNSSR
jgi:hypothetical protein